MRRCGCCVHAIMKPFILIAGILLWVNLLHAQEKIYRNSIGMEFVQIPAGEFSMGSEPSSIWHGD